MVSSRLLLPLALTAAALSLANCRTVGEQLGSTIGYSVGSTIGYGLPTTAGTVLGSVLGGEIAEALDPESQRRATEATGEAITTGQSQSWSNPSAGTSGEVEVTGQSQQNTTVQVEVLKDSVQELPPVDLIGATYVATAAANVRGGPSTDYKVVDGLTPGEAVNVVGKVRGKDWYMISKGDVIVGFVSTSLLAEPSTPLLPPDLKPQGAVAMETLPAERTCRTAEHRVRLPNGEIKTEEIDACETPTGWQSTTRPSAGGGNGGSARPT